MSRVRAVLSGLALVAVLIGIAVFTLRYLAPRPAHNPECGELTRIQSVAAIGVAGPGEATNILTYPHRAGVQLLPPSGVPPAATGGQAASDTGSDLGALVDECVSGWRSGPETRLPVMLLFEPRQAGAWVQRVGLWQDPTAPRNSWVQDFEVLASASEAGDDFQRLTFDRPARLQPTTEPQWFLVVRAAPSGGVVPRDLPPEERARYGQAFPDAVAVRRLLVRVLSTHGGQAGGRPPVVSLGEVAAHGADLEVIINDEVNMDGIRTGGLFFAPAELRALAGRPMFVLVINNSVENHTFVTIGQESNLELFAYARQAVSGQFVAAGRVGRYTFVCRLPGHEQRGLAGTLFVR